MATTVTAPASTNGRAVRPPVGTLRKRFHGTETRGLLGVPEGPSWNSYEGRFGRMFHRVPVFTPSDDFLRGLADQMADDLGQVGDNATIPAGFTYVGQFVDHDITFDPNSSLQRMNDPEALENFRTPRYDLDSLYGKGPADDPFLYDQETDGIKLLTGKVLDDDGNEIDEDDLQRNRQGRALIGDPRNDENIFIGQLQLAFAKFHNACVDRVASQGVLSDRQDVFKEAQRLARWHYQWIVSHEFLRAIVPQAVLDAVEWPATDPGGEPKLRFFKWKYRPFMPVEFSVAAYRYGHSQIRQRYKINQTVPVLPIFLPDAQPDRRADFRGFRGLPPQWTISWPFFFDIDGGPQASRKIDSRLVDALRVLPGNAAAPDDLKSLARRNLLRGKAMGLPSGDRVALAMGETPLDEGDLGFTEPPPLWFYVLKEAELQQGGERLGAVGGRIVAEVLLGLLLGDPLSYLRVQPEWQPELPSATSGDFTMADLLRFAVPDQAVRN